MWVFAPHAVEAQSPTRTLPPPQIYDGFTRPSHSVLVSADEMGRVKDVKVVMGQRVEAGEVMAELEDGLQTVSVEIARLRAKMEGERDAAVAEAQLVQQRFEKLKELAGKGMARPDELTRAEVNWHVANAHVKTLDEQHELHTLELDRAMAHLERRKIRCPYSGVISTVMVEPGEYLSPTSPALVELLVLDKIKVIFNMPVEQTKGIEAGTTVRVRSVSDGRLVEAPVIAISPKIDDRSATVEIHALIDNASGNWKAGDRCTVQLVKTKANSVTRSTRVSRRGHSHDERANR